MLLILQSIINSMGTVGSMCCESEPSKKSSPPLPVSNHNKPSVVPTEPVSEYKKQIQELEKELELNRQRMKAQEELLRKIEQTYAAPSQKMGWESFEVTHKIGDGGFGEVFLAELKINKEKGIKEKYAIKRVLKQHILEEKVKISLELQKKILQQMKSPFINSLFCAFRDEKYLYFVMDYAIGGDTYSLICEGSKRVDEFKAAGEPAVRFILGCLILGMEVLHNNNILYRDLKPQNILIFENGYVKLTDFGLAKEANQSDISKTEVGTKIYKAPEMILKNGYNRAADLWTLGVYAYEMSNYSPPFSGRDITDRLKVKRLVQMAQKDRSWKNSKTSPELKSFINDLLKFEPKDRLGVNGWDQVKNHAFFTSANFDWKALQQLTEPSPLKSIIQKYKLEHKPYNPNQIPSTKGKVPVKALTGLKQPQGWSCVRAKA